MSIFKCKMCGAQLDITEGQTIVECGSCGTKQTLPAFDDEKKIQLFSRANKLRFNCEFDKAAGIYETIAADFPDDPEAYWGIILCKYGIEYVDDPATGKKIPTCHRSSFDSVFDDNCFDLIMENSDTLARSIYRSEAKAIEEIRKGIIEVSSKEEPYDIFICYKETDDSGSRTLDSVIAQDVYDALTEKGYKVFFSRVSLEDKLGREYEPYIFAALNSAKVMLAFGTCYDYYNSVWVKNEWSRYLLLIASGQKKTLIPCYKGIDAYDMPKEFMKLQAQDMGKVGAIQDLLRGIDKIVKPVIVQPVMNMSATTDSSGGDISPLLERAFIFLEDGKWNDADAYCEKVLDRQPKCADAYLGKLMASLRVRSKDDLKNQKEPFDHLDDCVKACRFDESLAEELRADNAYIREQADIALIMPKYKSAVGAMNCARTEDGFLAVAELFDSLGDFKDSVQKAKECREKSKETKYNDYLTKLSNSDSETSLLELAGLFEAFDYRDCKEKAGECIEKANRIKYNKLVNSLENADSENELFKLADIFDAFDYKDSKLKANECIDRANELKYNRLYNIFINSESEEELAKAVEDFKNFDYRDCSYLAEQCAEKLTNVRNQPIYDKAVASLNEGCNSNKTLQRKIELVNDAKIKFESLLLWKDCTEKIKECDEVLENLKIKVEEKNNRIKEEKLREEAKQRKRLIAYAIIAAVIFTFLICLLIYHTAVLPGKDYKKGLAAYDAGDYKTAYYYFGKRDYKDSNIKYSLSKLYYAKSLIEIGENDDAYDELKDMEYYYDIGETVYSEAVNFLDSGENTAAYIAFHKTGDLNDSRDKEIDILKENPVIFFEQFDVVETGDPMVLGKYYQTNDKKKEQIVWTVIDKDDVEETVDVLCEYDLDCQPYNEEQADVTWEYSSIRKWLNEDFYNAAFSKEEKAYIVSAERSAAANSTYSSDAGNSTTEKIILPDKAAVSSDFEFTTTTYSMKIGKEHYDGKYTPCIWLHNPGESNEKALLVSDDGTVDDIGENVSCYFGICPEMTVSASNDNEVKNKLTYTPVSEETIIETTTEATTVTITEATAQIKSRFYAYVSTQESDLNVRKDADKNSEVIASLEKGKIVYINNINDNWVHISFQVNYETYTGWVSSEFLMPCNDLTYFFVDANSNKNGAEYYVFYDSSYIAEGSKVMKAYFSKAKEYYKSVKSNDVDYNQYSGFDYVCSRKSSDGTYTFIYTFKDDKGNTTYFFEYNPELKNSIWAEENFSSCSGMVYYNGKMTDDPNNFETPALNLLYKQHPELRGEDYSINYNADYINISFDSLAVGYEVDYNLTSVKDGYYSAV